MCVPTSFLIYFLFKFITFFFVCVWLEWERRSLINFYCERISDKKKLPFSKFLSLLLITNTNEQTIKTTKIYIDHVKKYKFEPLFLHTHTRTHIEIDCKLLSSSRFHKTLSYIYMTHERDTKLFKNTKKRTGTTPMLLKKKKM